MRGGRSPAGSPSYKLRQPGMRLGTWLLQRHAAGDARLVPSMGRAQVLLHMQETPDARQSEGTGRQTYRATTGSRIEKHEDPHRAPSADPNSEQTYALSFTSRQRSGSASTTSTTGFRMRGTCTRRPLSPGSHDAPLRRFMSTCLTRVRPHACIRQPVSLQQSSYTAATGWQHATLGSWWRSRGAPGCTCR